MAEILESVGFTHFWGLTPALNIIDQNYEKDTLNVLLSGTSDIRHILKTVSDNIKDKSNIKKINFYMQEKQKEPFARMMLLFEILHQKQLSYKERIDLFEDIFGNTLVRQKTQRFIDCFIPQLLNFLTDSKNVKTVLKHLFDLKTIKYKERDQLVDIVKSWHSSVPYTIEKHRDQRIRYVLKTRYDYKKNLIDWDYNMGLKEQAPIVHYIHYKEWRLTGVAFEAGFQSYIVPNRTLASYIPGKSKSEHTSCMVRGYWGDIITSPYVAFGVESEYEPLLFKIANKQQCGNSVEVTDFNLQYFLQMIDTKTEYIKVFTDMYRKKHNRRPEDRGEEDEEEKKARLAKEKKEKEAEEEKERLEKCKQDGEYREEVVEMIREEEGEDQEDEEEGEEEKKIKQAKKEKKMAEQKQKQEEINKQLKETEEKIKEQQQQQNDNQEQEIQEKKISPKEEEKQQDNTEIQEQKPTPELSQRAQEKEQQLEEQQQQEESSSNMSEQDSDSTQDDISQASTVVSRGHHNGPQDGDLYQEEDHGLLDGFKSNIQISVLPVFEDVSVLVSKKKWKNFFDIGVVGFTMNGQFNNKEFKNLFVEDATVYAEKNTYIVPMKKDEKTQYEGQLLDLAQQNGFKISDCSVDHHFSFKVSSEQSQKKE